MAKRKTKQEANNNGKVHPSRTFHEPKEIYDAFTKYKEYLILEAANWPKVQYVGKDGKRVTDNPVLPFTMDGFEVFCYDRYGRIDQYFDNREGYYVDFLSICSRIRMEIRDNQITGGMLSQFNPSITQRLNNLKETIEQTNNIKLDQITGMDVK